MLRPVHIFLTLLLPVILLDAGGYAWLHRDKEAVAAQEIKTGRLISTLALSNICVSTEARYIRHLTISDPVAPFMDYPAAIEHFPSGSFWAPPTAQAKVIRKK